MAKEDALIAIDAEAVEAARAKALPEAHLLLLVETFEALADLTRARILYALIQQPLCVRDLAILVGISESGVSHQLRFLRDRRLVKPRREGNVIYYVVDDHHATALVASIGNAALRGSLVKKGATIEAMAKVTAVAFDKTGTLTFGQPRLTIIQPLGSVAETELLRLAAIAEKLSEHPLGRAGVQAALAREVTVADDE
jgi:DNA-binding transcriptional ArsR family regulator